MSLRVALVPCVKSKRDVASPARDLYASPLFRGMRRYAETHTDTWYILSAEHGLVHPDRIIAPYERTLNTMGKSERQQWAENVGRELIRVLPVGAEVVVLGGARYRQGIVPFLRDHGFSVTVPLEGLRFGQQLKRLNELSAAQADNPDLEQFYSLLADLAAHDGQGRKLAEYTGSSSWPDRGVYFFQEPGEYRSRRPTTPRIVRVGTHAVSANAKSRLWQRLRAHRGGKDGGGNHRGSIFRLHVGSALLRRDYGQIGELPTWASGQTAEKQVRQAEAAHEQRVSAYIGNMSVLWLAVPDSPGPQSQRAYIERNAIALLSNQMRPLDPPSAAWLGRSSVRSEIRDSGLWNLNHVQEAYDPQFLEVLAGLTSRMPDGE